MLTGHDFNLSHFVLHDLPHEVFHVDGKVPRTLRLLFVRPGFLPSEFVAGRRTPYVPPLRLYILVYLAYVLISAASPHSVQTLPQRAAEIDPTGWVNHLAAMRSTVHWDNPDIRESIATRAHWMAEGGTMLIFLCVALVQLAVFKNLNRRYLEHAALGMSVATFFLLLTSASSLALLAAHLGPADQTSLLTSQGLDMLALCIYWYFAIRRFYGTSAIRSAAATIVIAAAQILIAIALNIGVLASLVVTT
jgi:Protein of unknown function (DUF3667)